MEIREEAYAGLPISVPVIDTHTHILPSAGSGIYQSITTPAEIVGLMDKVGINCIVTAPHAITSGNARRANEEAEKAALAFPGRFYGHISICPHDGVEGVKAELARYGKSPHFLGLKLLGGYHGNLDRPEYKYALDFAAEIGCPVLTHSWGNAPTHESIEAAVHERPKLKLIVAHVGGGKLDSFLIHAKRMQEYPNIYMDVCGSIDIPLTMEEILSHVDENRVVYGSDLIYLDPRYDLGRIIFSTLPDSTKKKLLAENYLHILEGSQMGRINL